MKGIHIMHDVIIYNDMPKGWVRGKTQPRWHHKVYDMWKKMWKRVYTELHWFGSLIEPSFKYLSSYVKWIESQPNFEEFYKTCNTTMWSIDKDAKCPGNKNYYPKYMTLMPHSDNARERNIRNGSPFLNRKKPVLGIPLDKAKKIIIASFINDVLKYGFNQSNVSNCLAKRHKTHKGYKWYYINYKHNKRFKVNRR